MRRAVSIPDKMRKRFHFQSRTHPAFIFPPEDRSRYYDFVDTPVNWRPSSPLIERQHLTPVDEVQLRHSCKVLFELIARGEIPPPLIPSARSFPERKATSERVVPEPPRLLPSKLVERHGQHVSEETNETVPAGRGLCDAGIVIEEETIAESPKIGELAVETYENKVGTQENDCEDSLQDFAGVGLAQFYPDESEDLTSSIRDKAPVIPVIGSWQPPDHRYSIDEQGAADDAYFTKGMFVGPRFEVTGVNSSDSTIRPTTAAETDALKSANVNPVRDLAGPSLLNRTPSFSRPHSSLSRATSRRVLHPCDTVAAIPQKNRDISPGRSGVYQHRSQSSWETRPGVPGEHALGAAGGFTGGRVDRKTGVAVIIDTDGSEHAMSASEEKQRYQNLQHAVMEKMFTGTIGTGPEISISYSSDDRYLSAERAISRPSSSAVSKSHQRRGSGAYSTSYASGNVDETHRHPPASNSSPKKPSIMRKLSVLTLGKKKSTNVSKDVNMTGFGRIVEAS